MNCYIHIPFCDSICFYCDFCRVVSSKKNQYLDALELEIKTHGVHDIDTLYFGGGTPSSLSIDQLTRLCSFFKPYLNNSYEWTIECNPDSLDLEKIKLFKEMGVNRISLGAQTFDNTLLKQIGRRHSAQDVFRCIKELRQEGIENISIDLIYGLPNQTINQLNSDLSMFLQLDLPHISIYSLQIEENSVFGKKNVQPIDEELEEQMYDLICQRLSEYNHYEISSFCKEGKHSMHNLCYWSDNDFIGFGCGASGKENNVRYDHVFNINEYINNPLAKTWIEESREEQMFDAIMMSLRTSFGLDIDKFNKKYQTDFYSRYENVIKKYISFFDCTKKRIVCTQKGRDVLNTILIDFME